MVRRKWYFGKSPVFREYLSRLTTNPNLSRLTTNPNPDPDALERATYESVGWTPQVKIDGRLIDGAYGSRARAETVFQVLGKALDTDLATPSGVILKLKARLTPAHTLAASADVNVANPEALKQLLGARIESGSPSTAVTRQGSVGVQDAANKPPRLVLNFALVQKIVRYSGENGIRFHSMVVRSLSKPSADGFPIAVTGSSIASFTFDPSAISASLGRYLAAYAQHNERFGTAHFLMTDTHLPPEQLAVAAWVEDSVTHHVVAAAFATPETETQKAAR